MSLLVCHVACPIGQTWLHSDDYVTAKWESVDRLQFFPVTGVWAWVSVGALNLPLGLQFCASLTSWHGLPILFKNLIGQFNVIHTSSQQGHSLVRYCLPEDGDFKRSSKWSWLAGCGVSLLLHYVSAVDLSWCQIVLDHYRCTGLKALNRKLQKTQK